MHIFLQAFLTVLIATLLFVRYAHVHGKVSTDHDVEVVQKFHEHPVPRIGGVRIFLALLAVGGFLAFFDKGLMIHIGY